ncbi:hypothetical protein CPB84DRAFT_1843297 [Gymnopilus junonius]|uniref:SET domain-containing protein n=1 Tax=Gymnopilus junonius TaxID=109634 RepID=A0A9P5TSI6_GYMJU|nr:hypothetical protein CPB84DRAFT_1843297 [Gymnopilus junonius]
MISEIELSPGPEHLNNSGCVIKCSSGKGRGVYASHSIPRNTLIEISPVLLFSKNEYEEHGKHTVLDHYTFKWTEGRMALALGLGSLFNHSESPNVSFSLDTKNDSIRYTTSRHIMPGEELCIFYGFELWFSPTDRNSSAVQGIIPADDGWGGLTAVQHNDDRSKTINSYDGGGLDEIISEENLPFTKFKPPPEEEDAESIRTVNAWVALYYICNGTCNQPIKWLKTVGLEGPELGHLKRIRKQEEKTSLLLSTALGPPELPHDLNLPAPYSVPVPASSALTLLSLSLKCALWPTMYTPRRKDEPEVWTRGKLRWAWNAMKRAVDTAIMGQAEAEELSIAAYIPATYGTPDDENGQSIADSLSFTACDSRNSTRHPLRHAAVNTIRKLADYCASDDPIKSSLILDSSSDEVARNGTHYLLTNRSFFITHEPCIMCSMALLHSRVKDIFFLYPMSQTGGCGGCACLPALKGVNHRFGILQWKDFAQFSDKDIRIDAAVDA